jgi:hypothetical protein
VFLEKLMHSQVSGCVRLVGALCAHVARSLNRGFLSEVPDGFSGKNFLVGTIFVGFAFW